MGTACLCVVTLVAGAVPLRAEEPKPGEPLHGLQLTLTATQPTWKLGTVMELEAMLKNVSDKPFVIDVFGELNTVYTPWVRGAYALTPWLLSWQEAETGRDVLGPRTINGGERTLHADQYELLQPGAVYVKHLWYKLDNFPTGSYAVTLRYGPVPHPALEPSQPLWTGRMIYSSPLEIEVIEIHKTGD